MAKTSKQYSNKKNVTKKNVTKRNKSQIMCKSSYIPFEKEYSKILLSNNYKKTGKQIINTFLRQLSFEQSQSKVMPQNDFYTFVNYRWLTDKESDSIILDKRQKYITQVDDFRIIQDKVYYQLFDIMRDYCNKNHNPLSKCIKNFYTAAMNLNPIKKSKQYIHSYIDYLDDLRKDDKNVWKLLGYINRNEQISHGAPFVWSMNPDDKNTKIYCSNITPTVFALVDLSVYYDDGTNVAYKKKYRDGYFKYCELLFEGCSDLKYVPLGLNSVLGILKPSCVMPLYFCS